ncbi:hypothetical protein Vi05172_g9412 [Venturia inaequalis]|nr:hypothetical protein Vi05172_g9412 [Venturia inaequalis]
MGHDFQVYGQEANIQSRLKILAGYGINLCRHSRFREQSDQADYGNLGERASEVLPDH